MNEIVPIPAATVQNTANAVHGIPKRNAPVDVGVKNFLIGVPDQTIVSPNSNSDLTMC